PGPKAITQLGKQVAEPPAALAKEPWEMTKDEFVNDVRNGRDFKQLGVKPTPLDTLRGAKDFESLDRQAASHHNARVTMAVAEGKPVPAEVLKDYPELAKPASAPPPAEAGSLPAAGSPEYEAMKARIAELEGKQAPGAPIPSSAQVAGGNTVADRLRTVADRMDAQIDNARREMTQNPTPKRMAEYRSRIIEADEMERTQKAMRALADAHEAGTVPQELAALRSKDEIGRLVHKGLDTSKGGYYDRIPR